MEVVCVGYSHSWQLNRSNFTEAFLDDVKGLLLDFVTILQDIKVNLKEKFGYMFERSYGLDEHGNKAIILKPLININASNIQHKTKTIILSKLQNEYDSIGKSLGDLEKESENKEIIDIIYKKTEMFQNYLFLLKDSEKK